jgi:HAD superfamily hydrolase (TIGR01459 family)
MVSGLAGLVDEYDGYLVDSYGVLHDGKSLYPGTRDCLMQLQRHGKRVVILTNTPRRASTVGQEIARVGVTPDSYNLVISAGEVSHRLLRHLQSVEPAVTGKRCFYIGPDRSRELLDGLDLEKADDLCHADFLLITGLETSSHEVEDYGDVLSRAADRGIPAICANPDISAIRAGKSGPCAGAVALRYEESGGMVRYFGKPYPEIYDMAIEFLQGITAERIIGVGDLFATDILGARSYGLDALFISEGVHRDELLRDGEMDLMKLRKLCVQTGTTPSVVTGGFRW